MQAYKLNGRIDESGNLIIDEPLNIAPGKVEVIILQPIPTLESSTETQTQSNNCCSKPQLFEQVGVLNS